MSLSVWPVTLRDPHISLSQLWDIKQMSSYLALYKVLRVEFRSSLYQMFYFDLCGWDKNTLTKTNSEEAKFSLS